jgi:hypothetical protein
MLVGAAGKGMLKAGSPAKAAPGSGMAGALGWKGWRAAAAGAVVGPADAGTGAPVACADAGAWYALLLELMPLAVLLLLLAFGRALGAAPPWELGGAAGWCGRGAAGAAAAVDADVSAT